MLIDFLNVFLGAYDACTEAFSFPDSNLVRGIFAAVIMTVMLITVCASTYCIIRALGSWLRARSD